MSLFFYWKHFVSWTRVSSGESKIQQNYLTSFLWRFDITVAIILTQHVLYILYMFLTHYLVLFNTAASFMLFKNQHGEFKLIVGNASQWLILCLHLLSMWLYYQVIMQGKTTSFLLLSFIKRGFGIWDLRVSCKKQPLTLLYHARNNYITMISMHIVAWFFFWVWFSIVYSSFWEQHFLAVYSFWYVIRKIFFKAEF